MREERVIAAASIIAAHLEDEAEQIVALTEHGFSVGEANRLVALLPMAFSRPIVEELGASVAPMIAASMPDGTWVEAVLTRQPEYVGALALARRHRREGRMDHALYVAIAGSTADIDSLSKALNEHGDVKGSVVSSALVGCDRTEHLFR